jgi:hypothetical protein
MNLKIASGLIALCMFVGAAGAAIAGDKDKDDKNLNTVTGCLQRSDAQREYVLVTEDGKSYTLRGNEHDFNTHIGEKVSVSGDITTDATAPNDMSATNRDNDRDKDKDDMKHTENVRAGHINVKSVSKVEGTCHPWKEQQK